MIPSEPACGHALALCTWTVITYLGDAGSAWRRQNKA